tara:strand:+ start:13199 stop:15160 length:1962 start_codon:yes stop_codon:yes gene_type:complete
VTGPVISCCCIDPDTVFFFVPCPGTDPCADTFFATKSQWETILGQTPQEDDVYKYDNGNREIPCVYCGKLQTAFAGGSPAPSGGFEKQDDCDDDDCPEPYYFFTPCNEACNTYTMAAVADVWNDLLSITIDSSNPSSYAGTWEFTRTDGDPCCHVDDNGDPIEGDPCHKFCGTLKNNGSTSNLCFDSSHPDNTPPCEKCSPDTDDVQVIGCTNCNSTSGMTFVLKSGGCNDPACVECRTQECNRTGSSNPSKLEYKGRKTVTFNNWNINQNIENCVNTSKTIATSDYNFDIQVIIDYTVYMQGNQSTGDSSDPVPIILSEHAKNPCVVIDNVSFSHTWNFLATSTRTTFSGPGCSGSILSVEVAKDEMINASISLVDQGTPSTTRPPLITEARLEKRICLYEDGAECSGTPNPNNQVCPLDIAIDQCIMNYLNCGELYLQLTATYKSTFTDAGGTTDETIIGPVISTVPIGITTAMLQDDAKEMCCCDDTPEYNSMYWTDFPSIAELTTALSWNGADETSLAVNGCDFDRQYKDGGDLQRLWDDSANAWGFGAGFGLNNGVLDGAYLDPEAGLAHINFDGSRNYACNLVRDGEPIWSFQLPSPATSQSIPNVDSGTRDISVDYSISESVISLECIPDNEVPGSSCEDGVLDVP